MNTTRAALLLSLLSLLMVCPNQARADASRDVFLLTVTLRDPYNPQLVLSLPVTVGQPFSVTFTNGPIVTTVSGTLGPPVGGKYALPGNISEGPVSHPGFSGGLTNPLELGKAETFSVTAGQIVFRQTLLLTRLKAADAFQDALPPTPHGAVFGRLRRACT